MNALMTSLISWEPTEEEPRYTLLEMVELGLPGVFLELDSPVFQN